VRVLSLQAQAYDSGFGSLQASPIMATSPTITPTSAGAATPSNTLFVTNLGPFCLEQELTDLFASFPGFQRLRMTKQPVAMQNGGTSFCAFVEYLVSFSWLHTLISHHLEGCVAERNL